MRIVYRVDKKNHNLMLKQVLKQELQISSALRREIVQSSACTVNGEIVYTTSRVKEGDNISVDLDKTNEREVKKDTLQNDETIEIDKINIVYEDEYILAVNKEAGISCHPNANQKENTLTEQVQKYYGEKKYNYKVHIVNRLDRNTSGMCIFAKHKYIQELLSKAMKTDDFKKEYIAVVHGEMERDQGLLEGKIARKNDSIILREVSEDGDIAKTEYFVLSYNKEKNYSVLKIILHTGKTHQIRVHMSDIGHPLIGDDLYIKEAREKYIIKNICGNIDRQALHAKKICIKLDILNMNIELEAKLPEDMKVLL